TAKAGASSVDGPTAGRVCAVVALPVFARSTGCPGRTWPASWPQDKRDGRGSHVVFVGRRVQEVDQQGIDEIGTFQAGKVTGPGQLQVAGVGQPLGEVGADLPEVGQVVAAGDDQGGRRDRGQVDLNGDRFELLGRDLYLVGALLHRPDQLTGRLVGL